MIRLLLAFCILFSSLAFGELKRMARLGAAFQAEDGKLVLRQVAADGNAAKAGLRDGDVIVSIDGKKAEPSSTFVRPLLRREAGSKATFVVEPSKSLDVVYAAPRSEQGIPGSVDVVYGSVPVADHERRTLITLPAARKKQSAILFLAGSGCGSQESPDLTDPAVQILYELTRRGFVTMRVEKTGMGDSGGPPCYSDAGGMDQEVAGYRAGYAALAAHPSVDPKRIYLLGHSAGGTLAPLVAKDLRVAGIIVAGAMGSDFLSYILGMRERERTLAGYPESEVASMMEVTRGCLLQLFVEGKTADEIEKANPACKKQVRFDSPAVFTKQWYKLDLSEAWAGITAPVIVMYGTGDFVTSEEESSALVTRINAKGSRQQQARLVVLPMDHGFFGHAAPDRAWKAEQGIVPPAGALTERVCDSIVSFVEDTRRK